MPATVKVPTPRKLPSGSWTVQLCLHRHRISVTEKTKAACVARALAIQQDMLAPVDRSQKPTLTHCIDRYIEDRYAVLSPATVRGYRIIQRNRFQDLMDHPVNVPTAQDWQRVINRESRLVSAKTLQNAWRFVSSVIYDATGQRFEPRLPQVVDKSHAFLSAEQIPVFLAAIEGSRYELPALLALHSLRISEIKALTWAQVDLKKKQILVQGSVVPDENNQFVQKDTNKNRSSRRLVPIMSPRLLELLENQKGPRASHLVLEHPNSIRNGINKVCLSLDLPPVGLHGLRHSFASLAYSLGVREKYTMQLGGWSNDATMEKIYTHLSLQDLNENVSAFSAYFNSLNNSPA